MNSNEKQHKCMPFRSTLSEKKHIQKKTPIKQILQFTVPNEYLFDITIYFVSLAIQFLKHFILTLPVLQALLLWSGIIS